MDARVLKIVTELKENISGRYKIHDFRIFGSTARDQHDRESDIDLFIILNHVDRQIEEDLFDLAYEIELKYDCLIDLIVFGKDALNGRLSYAPFYVRAMEEGVLI